MDRRTRPLRLQGKTSQHKFCIKNEHAITRTHPERKQERSSSKHRNRRCRGSDPGASASKNQSQSSHHGQTKKHPKHMKTNHSLQNTASATTQSTHQSPPQLTVPLSQAVQEFLKEKQPFCGKNYLRTLDWVLSKCRATLGNLPIGKVTAAQISKVVRAPGLHPRAQKQRAIVIKTFFNWSRSQDYLPSGRPTPAHTIDVRIPKFVPKILSPAELKNLLAGTQDVEVLLSIVLPVFTGIRLGELERLRWNHIAPGKRIYLGPETGVRFGRSLPILTVLDAWVRPFYGSQGTVISSMTVRHKLHRLARVLGVPWKHNGLRISFCAYRLAQTGNLAKTVIETGRPAFVLRELVHGVTGAEAEEFFSLTPEAVGIKNWTTIVAKHLKKREATGPAQARQFRAKKNQTGAPAQKAHGLHLIENPELPPKSKSAGASPAMPIQPKPGGSKNGSRAAR
jgi:hypothetical protein